MPTFSTDFAPPPALTGLTLEADLESSAVRLSWDPTALLPEDFAGYRVRRRVGSGDWVLLADLADPAAVEYDDHTAPLNVGLTYSLTQSSLDFESDEAQASGELPSLMWWAVAPGDDTLTFGIPHIRAARLTSPKVAETYSPIGRPSKLVVTDVVQAEDGELAFQIRPGESAMIERLPRLQAYTDELLLKSPEGKVFRVSVGTIQRVYTKLPGLQEVTLPFVSV